MDGVARADEAARADGAVRVDGVARADEAARADGAVRVDEVVWLGEGACDMVNTTKMEIKIQAY